ncbi:MAG: ADOP family duplicated permease [Longimicrobiales bacterium]|nr:ADOP family duplicated permease [Longimicrobiales bacterium]
MQSRTREEQGMALFDEALRNLRFALRGMARRPLLSTTFVLTLALCIGFGTAVFSMVDPVLWRPLPYPDPDHLAHAVLYNPDFGKIPGNTAVDGRTWERIRAEGMGFQRAVYSSWASGANLSTDATSTFVQQQRIGSGYFRALGIAPQLGREFEATEDVPGGPPVAILSHDLWTRTFGGNREMIGETIRLKGEAHTVVGIMPSDFISYADAEVWTPLRASTQGEGTGTNYAILVRFPKEMSLQEADARFASIHPPEATGENASEVRLGLVSLDQALTAGVRFPVLILLGAMGIMVLVGCANLAGLQIARTLARKTEVATRQALGGGAGALVRQVTMENLLLGLTGGAAGLEVAYLSMGGLETLVRTHFGTWLTVGLDGRALAVSLALTLISTLFFGLVPVLQVSRPDLQRTQISGSRTLVGGGGHTLRKALLVGEVALVTALLFAAGLLVRSYGYLEGLDPGFDPEGVLTVQMSLDDARYAEPENIQRLFRETQANISALPGVAFAAVALTLPYERPLNLGFRFSGEDTDVFRITNAVYITRGFFETLAIPFLQGRDLEAGDREGAPFVAVANQAWVDANLEGRAAVGTRIRMGFAGEEEIEVVGVVGNVLQAAGGREGPAPVWGTPTLYLAAAQASGPFMQLVHVWFSPSWIVRVRNPGQELAASVTHALQEVDPGLPVARVSMMEGVMNQAFAEPRFEALFLVLVASFALLLAGIGLYGIVAHEVLERRAEMGLRMALGSTPWGAVWTAGVGGLRLTFLGLVLGGLLSALIARVLVHLIYGVTAFDPMTLALLVGILTLFAGVASFVPASRVARMDPARILVEG